ncbi:DUF2894 domain-containing protein [Hydrogenophaga pseudoflava]|uniref:DUF2894 domain-containing protein n=1 Tax=Hydrogenophaga pseudoflava TaxID=47421 RepID=UPI0027E49280|nr:DUF2894 domain-containing protein [Hydrogenophaga pseudoflava]MDQ7744736.1 DUF2894 domain-containing protein [Hydrogenophaga pseudoflava]
MKPAAARPSLLAELHAHIERASAAARDDVTASGAGPWPELRSAQRFRETWERIGAEVRVQQARDRAPPNAGPLNPQRLMLETLARMGELSPHYLRRFLTHTETLLWLEQAHGLLRPPAAGKGGAGKLARAGRQKK